MKVTKIVSDVTGEEISDYIEVLIRRPGYSIRDKQGNVYNEIMMHIKENEIKDVLKNIKFEKMDYSKIM